MKNISKKISIVLLIAGFLLYGAQSAIGVYEYTEIKPTLYRGWLYVGGIGPNNYTSIQDAIDNASNGDIIFVYAGTYNENLIISISIILLGEDRDTTIINGDTSSETVKITVAEITIEGFTIKNDGSQTGIFTSTDDHIFTDDIITMTTYGIYLDFSSNNTVTDSVFYNNTKTGIYIGVGKNNNISNNELYNNDEQGIYFTGCGATLILSNYIHDNGEGISGFNANGNTIKNNIIEFNGCGIHFDGMITLHSNFNKISHNRINDNTGCGLRIEHSQFNTIENNEIERNNIGIHFEITALNTIKNNKINDSDTSEITFTFSLFDRVTKNNIENDQQSLVLAQISLGFSIATKNWWGSSQWPLRRVRAIFGWIIVTPWQTSPLTLDVGPEP
jgi:parallel beta-helix repeat protein